MSPQPPAISGLSFSSRLAGGCCTVAWHRTDVEIEAQLSEVAVNLSLVPFPRVP